MPRKWNRGAGSGNGSAWRQDRCGVALGMNLDPLVLTVPVALAATCAFMLPVATPPNAVAYASGYVTIGQMIRGGIWLNVVGVVLITAACYTLFAWSLGIAY